jgi:glycosyltransferase involved in cell wall biosynthesis
VSDRPRLSANTTRAIDIFIDLSASAGAAPALQRVIAKWVCPESLGAIARRVTGVVAPGKLLDDTLPGRSGWAFAESKSPVSELSAALAAAGRDEIPLLLILGPVEATNEAVGVLRQCLERDPMFGFAVPRIGCLDGCCFARLSWHGVGPTDWLPRRILADLPDAELLVETAAPCMLIAPQVLGNFGPLEERFNDVAAAMLHYMASARRCGFRTVLSNRAVVGIDGLTCEALAVQPLPGLTDRDQTLLRQLVPDLDRGWREFRAGSWERFERLCISSIDRTKRASRPSLLLDVRNVGPVYNGTTHAVLGTVKAFKELRSMWDVAILAHPQGAVFHDLERLYAGWPVYTAVPEGPFTAALRPSQPWTIHEMVDLHNVSLFNAFLMLDTINWDIAYGAPHQLEGTWQFLADHADALLFDSDFTRQRFVERFPTARSVPSLVTHFSFDPSEYARADARKAAGGDEFIFVIGNDLDHKDVRHTVETLASAFPFRRIKAIGPADVVSPFVTAQHSGELSELEIHRLYASARFVVFPSFYEGFGFPILTALAYGRTVLARRSALLDEVAARCDPRRGRLVVFDRREELVELLGRLVHGEPVPEHPLGLGVTNGRPRRWRDVAQDILGFLESLLREPFRSRWIAREHTVRQFLSYRA